MVAELMAGSIGMIRPLSIPASRWTPHSAPTGWCCGPVAVSRSCSCSPGRIAASMNGVSGCATRSPMRIAPSMAVAGSVGELLRTAVGELLRNASPTVTSGSATETTTSAPPTARGNLNTRCSGLRGQSETDGYPRELCSTANPGLVPNPVKVGVNRLHTDEQFTGHLLIRATLGDERQDLTLPFR
jgi:hypothetical protein